MAESVGISDKNESTCSETTVEIKIKTLDSQTYTLRVDKCVPVPALKEQIASVTGVLSEQQRLICRGRVLKDDQLLSAYHVEDGHTLHLVVRQPVIPSSDTSPDAAADTVSSSGRSHRGPGILLGSFNISDQDGAIPDMSRVVSSFLGSVGLTSVGRGGEGFDLNELPTERVSLAPVLSSLRISNRQASQASLRRQSIPDSSPSRPTIDPVESLQPPVIPDSLATLSQNLSRLRQEFLSVAEQQNNTVQAAGSQGRNGQNLDGTLHFSMQRGLPTPASLADVMLTTRQLLNEQAAECLSQLAESLQTQSNVIDASERTRIQSNALRSGIIFQNLGALLLELGRTTMTLRMGETPADAVVNAGPAVFLSSNGPNPIMVQPLPFQPGTGLGAISGGTPQQSPGVSVSSGVYTRNIDIRIRTGSFMNSSTVNRRESATVQNNGQPAPTPNHGGGSESFGNRESEVRVLPVRTVITAVPASGSRLTSDQPSRGSGTMGFMYPVVARVQHMGSGNVHVTRAQGSAQPAANSVDLGGGGGGGSGSSGSQSVQQGSVSIPGIDLSRSSFVEVTDGQGVSPIVNHGLHELVSRMLQGENDQVIGGGGRGSGNSSGGDRQGMDSNLTVGNLPAAQSADNSTTASIEGAFLSNLLRQIMPIISENRGAASSNTSHSQSHNNNNNNNHHTENRQDSEQEQEIVDRGSSSSSSSRNGTPSEPNPKRQRRN